MKESQIEKKIREYAESQGCELKKFTSPGWVKVPDRILITPWVIVGFIEVKKPDGDIHPKQVRVCEHLNGRKVPSIIVDNLDEAKRFIDTLVAASRNMELLIPPDLRGEHVEHVFPEPVEE